MKIVTEKTILVTGASGGMGLAVCRLLTEKGYQVFGIDIREPDTMINWTFAQADLTDMRSVKAAKDNIQNQTDHIHLRHIVNYETVALDRQIARRSDICQMNCWIS